MTWLSVFTSLALVFARVPAKGDMSEFILGMNTNKKIEQNRERGQLTSRSYSCLGPSGNSRTWPRLPGREPRPWSPWCSSGFRLKSLHFVF